MPHISILLTTYNSERYLHELMESLIKQTYTNWTLYIVDDGSTDRTVQIIDDYVAQYSKVVRLINNKIRQGAKNNFVYLLSEVQSDYFMFCDHDDVWLPNKIEKSINKILKLENENPLVPIVVHSDLYVVDKSLNIISNSFFKYAGVNPRILLSSINHLSHSNCATGCTMIINRLAKEVSLPVLPEALMHDSWIALSVLQANGIIYCINEPLILYRQHDNNALGAISKNKNGLLKRLSYIHKSCLYNLKQYKMAKKISNISLLKFLLYRIIYICKNKKQ